MDLAVQILDGGTLRGVGKPMTVTRAKFEMKGEAYQPKQTPKQVKKKQLEKLEKKLGWGGFDDRLPPEKVLTWHIQHASCVHCKLQVCKWF